uniref:non-specific serine/threonine protein kinase n=1 Tax=Hordeum vulgare subsp. vulgare TaxID=112509 RepID=F2E166_HORVV|nr:predicted protein [Hordeum vulgare subsp. vulgare]
MSTSKPTTTSTSSNKKPETASNTQQPRKLSSFLSSKRKSGTSDAASLGTAFNNMKLSQDNKTTTTSSKDPSKEKKPSTTTTSKAPLKPLKDEKEPVATTKDPKSNEVIIKANNVTYCADSVVGNGSFGVVVRAIVSETREVVAIKKVLQDKRYKNRELQIMQTLSHPNIVELKNSFFTNGDKTDEIFLHLVLEFVPDTVYRVSRHYSKLKQSIPMIYIKVYTYQLLRALGYIHAIGVCHRDIKPQNLLLDPQLSIMKICDFGSAKMLVKGEPNVAYICSRYYRAPELVFGATNYTTAIDVWSAGCVLAELLLGQPLFPGESGVDQLVEIIKVLGTPTREEIQAMNHTYTDYKFPQIKGSPWSKVFRMRPVEAIDLVSKLLNYTPTNRLKPFEALAHPFFDELRTPGLTLPNGKPLPPLFNFSDIEIKEAGPLLSKILPSGTTPSANGGETSTLQQ